MVVERGAEVIKSLKVVFRMAIHLPRCREEFPSQVDSVNSGLVAVALPISVENILNQSRIEQFFKAGQAFDWKPLPYGLASEGLKFAPAGFDRNNFSRSDTFPFGAAPHLGEACEISLDFVTKCF